MDLPYFEGHDCRGCSACVAACPGLAVSLVRALDEDFAEVQIPFEYPADRFAIGDRLPLLDQYGQFLEDAPLVKKFHNKKYRTWILTCKVSLNLATRVIGVRIQQPTATAPLAAARFEYLPDEAIVCRCERVSVGQIVRFIQENAVTDVNQLKSLRVGMGACGSKTCAVLLPQIFRKAGVDPATVTAGTIRPLMLEVGLGEILAGSGGAAAGTATAASATTTSKGGLK
ncbi:MAG: hypothetical protein A2004_03920 [Spirochaetes bacterium GWC1_61_12]|nr:MAG: hypothetical protein A2004_03920 [Spirochaetes bacterium GWC1_61_12]